MVISFSHLLALGVVRDARAERRPPLFEPDWASAWRHFYEEVILGQDRWLGNYSTGPPSFPVGRVLLGAKPCRNQPRRHYVVFDSNMDENTGLNNYSDVYMIKVR